MNPSWLYVRGTLCSNGAYQPRPGLLLHKPITPLGEGTADVEVQTFARSNEILTRAHVHLTGHCAGGHAVRACVERPPHAARIGLSRQGIVLWEASIPVSAPVLQMTTCVLQTSSQELVVEWSVDREVTAQWASVRMRSGRVFTLKLPSPARSACFRLDRLPAAHAAQVVVRSSDGVTSGQIASECFDLEGGPDRVAIEEPSGMNTLRPNGILWLKGAAQDAGGQALSSARLRWTVNEIEVARGGAAGIPMPSPGVHQVGLHLDRVGSVEEYVQITVDRPLPAECVWARWIQGKTSAVRVGKELFSDSRMGARSSRSPVTAKGRLRP